MIMAIIGKFVNKDEGNRYSESDSTNFPYENSSLSEFVKEYAGGYTVELDGISSDIAAEAYALKDDGTATWMLISNRGGEAKVTSRKQGTWNAYQNRIEITINGNTGLITEYFERNSSNQYFDNKQTGRYLKPN